MNITGHSLPGEAITHWSAHDLNDSSLVADLVRHMLALRPVSVM